MLKKITALTTAVGLCLSSPAAKVSRAETADSWKQALPGWAYQFPRDHAVHPDFKTEWWYFTGNVQDESGRSFGYELTFFRQGILPTLEKSRLDADSLNPSRFVQGDFKFAHFAISDLRREKFYFVQEMNRGAFGEAGFGTLPPTGSEGRLAWIAGWELRTQPDGSWKISARADGATPMAIDLQVLPLKPPVIEGIDGVSQKAEGLGNASHYYSFTRLKTTGILSLGKDATPSRVHGESWFDHEWASNQLGAEQVGWDWFCCQFSDNTELMLYAMRRRDGSVDAVSSGTWVNPDGTTEHLQRDDFSLKPVRRWKSGLTGATYPLEWAVNIPGKQLQFTICPRQDNQELALPLISYWEGATALDGEKAGKRVSGVGYMELTGYSATLKGLQGKEQMSSDNMARSTR